MTDQEKRDAQRTADATVSRIMAVLAFGFGQRIRKGLRDVYKAAYTAGYDAGRIDGIRDAKKIVRKSTGAK